MRKIILIVILSVSIGNGMLHAQTSDTTAAAGWSQQFTTEFIQSCISSASKLSADSAERYCSCMAFKLEKMYPNETDAAKLTEEDIKKPELQQMMKDCLRPAWPAETRSVFVEECVKSAASMGDAKARKYCSCMLIKLEATMKPGDLDNLSEADFKKPPFSKFVASCLAQ